MEPVYAYRRSFRNTWQEYRVYPDRLELPFRLGFTTIVVPFGTLEAIEIRPPFSAGDLFRGKGFRFSFPLKIDASDMFGHIAIRRSKGLFRHIRFTPDDPGRFLAAVASLVPRLGNPPK